MSYSIINDILILDEYPFCMYYRHSSSLYLRRGFNLIEAAIVLGITGLVIGGVWVATSSVMLKQRVQQTIDGYQAVARTMKDVYGKESIVCNNCWGNITKVQLRAMMPTPPAGWTYNTDDTLDSPIFKNIEVGVTGKTGLSTDNDYIIWIWNLAGATSVSDCVAFGLEGTRRLSSGLYNYFGVWGDLTYFGAGKDASYQLYWENNGGRTYATPPVMGATAVTDCATGEINFLR